MKTRVLCTIFILFITGCATTISEKANHVQVHSQVSNLLDKCQRIGPVDATASSMASPNRAVQEAKIMLREKAADMGGDTVAILNTDTNTGFTTWETSIQGVVFKCY